MENKKLKLDELRVQSFVIEFEKGEGQTLQVQGGIPALPTIQLPCVPLTGKVTCG